MTAASAHEQDVQLFHWVECCPACPNQRPSRLCLSGLSRGLRPWRLASEDSGFLPMPRMKERVLLLFFPLGTRVLGPRKVGLSPARVCHAQLRSAGCPLRLQFSTAGIQSRRTPLMLPLCPALTSHTVPKSPPVLSPPACSLSVTPPLPSGLPPTHCWASNCSEPWKEGPRESMSLACSRGWPRRGLSLAACGVWAD